MKISLAALAWRTVIEDMSGGESRVQRICDERSE
ncbi:hypothetical protein FOXG_20200 [Fusarium oxysporum f. sp. lycopersici 4287]|uniref:Uncharacterized protein n=2 Tax=Fusarium oxysporum TaxID=5507 RepID=A0A0J9WPQ2_FUSO4|nr:hypothetical protein FOXG_20200 [Fusarium oxysporum f. sp. lycopersici 4287]EXK28269.1 hypothetical protein FOMG_15269 [Fusarium oxysporum f. sp. melonis 26406]KNB09427.1 hypothetical protein FOXG_20200 [Fusarium oxysporum f. sp. lycopersici 4287]